MRLFHFTSATYGLNAIRDQQYKLSTYDNLNDPFELFAPDLADAKVRAVFQKGKDLCAKQMALLCCSKSWSNTLLWSHYAEKHTGVALELDVADECITHVKYQKTRTPMSRQDMDENMRREDGLGVGAAMFGIKGIDWAYEDEARISHNIRHLNRPQNGLYFSPFNNVISLRGVVLGPLCKLSPDDLQENLPAGTRLSVRKSRIAFRSFKVVSDLRFKPRQLVGAA
ncbi:DUF2971 domain-containing protein [Rhodanobacter sp. AS-Z3]|uniref:DUF2971 domain-containing protein n=1 Tax=Rhodanobacter sp. AS-Z3 TaxID=3031330 RepID=UPI002478DF1C|nr:DUF2971 domain-containing protein [Rhodanobacter sp. AS-Z3]WEN13870.1 DUF2971 domain-containing protein [Rhodanobacter sp. AS-Z3]